MKARLITLTAVAAAVVATIAPAPASASLNTDAQLICTEMIGFRFELPAAGSARQSLFYFSVDGGPWQQTHWYYTSGLTWMVYRPNIGWQYTAPGGGFLPIYQFQDSATHTIEGYEWRVVAGRGSWIHLDSCQASTYTWGDGGIVLR